jgi:hypothetical protein
MAVFVLFLAVGDWLALGRWEYPVRVVVLAAILWFFSRHVIDFSTRFRVASVGVGVAVFVVWVLPDTLWPDYRSHWLFRNALTGEVQSRLPADLRGKPDVLVFRAIRAVILVPIIEELFWRAWLMRWLVNNNFSRVGLGTYHPGAFWITAALFAVEHGPYWEVGLLAGIAYNYWMVRTRSLGDCILAHAVTNAALSAFVVGTGRWEYWL